jgi:hypothetical protein
MSFLSRFARNAWQRFFVLLETGFEVMARYPHDLTELHWNSTYFDPPSEPDEPGGSRPARPLTPVPGRDIKLVPSPAARRYQSALSRRKHARRPRQPV